MRLGNINLGHSSSYAIPICATVSFFILRRLKPDTCSSALLWIRSEDYRALYDRILLETANVQFVNDLCQGKTWGEIP